MDDPHTPLEELLRSGPRTSPIDGVIRRWRAIPDALRWAVLVVVLVAAAGGIAFGAHSRRPPIEVDLPRAARPAPPGPTTTVPDTIVAHVAGALVSPGVVTLPAGARVADAIAAAGGARGDADLDRVNLAAPLSDGGRIYVPVVGGPDVAAAETGEHAAGAGADGPKVNLNTASAADLEQLPGVGPATAAAIIAHRERSGRFRQVDDLLEVRGIGPAKLEGLRDLVVTR